MGWEKRARAALRKGEEASVKLEESEIKIAPTGDRRLRVGDTVFVKVNSRDHIDRIRAVETGRFLIGTENTIRGWVRIESIYGVVQTP